MFLRGSSVESKQPDPADYRFPLDEEANEMLHALGLPERLTREIAYLPKSFSFRFTSPGTYIKLQLSHEVFGSYSQARVRNDCVDLSFPRQIVDDRGGNGLVSLTFRHDPGQGALIAAGHTVELDLAEEATILWLSQRDLRAELSTADSCFLT